jgi:hypothetical protein
VYAFPGACNPYEIEPVAVYNTFPVARSMLSNVPEGEGLFMNNLPSMITELIATPVAL